MRTRSRLAILLCLIALVALWVASAARAQVGACTVQSMTGNPVNIRSGPGAHFDALNAFGAGELIPVIARADNGWVKVQMSIGFTGFAPESEVSFAGECGGVPMLSAAQYAMPTQDNSLPPDVSPFDVVIPQDMCTVTARGEGAVIYTTAEPVSAPVGFLSPGPWLVVNAWDGGAWYRVTMLNGGIGWVELGTVDVHGACGGLELIALLREATLPAETWRTCNVWTTGSVSAYAYASANAPVVSSLTPNAYYQIFSQVDGWYEVYHESGQLLWVMKSLVSQEGDCASAPLPTPTLPAPPSTVQQPCTVTAPGLNVTVYDRPEGAAIGTLPPGVPYTPLTGVDGGWLEIYLSDQQRTGWVFWYDVTTAGNCAAVPYPTEIGSSAQPENDFTCTVSTIQIDLVRVYRHADVNSAFIGTLPSQTPFTVFAQSNGMFEIFVDGLGLGWVQPTQVQVTGNCNTVPAPTPTLPATTPSATWVPTLFPTLTPTPEFGVCVVVSASASPQTLRVGPGTDYAAHEQMQPAQPYLGVTRSDNGWIELSTVDRDRRLVGWLPGHAAILSAPCAVLPMARTTEYEAEEWYPTDEM